MKHVTEIALLSSRHYYTNFIAVAVPSTTPSSRSIIDLVLRPPSLANPSHCQRNLCTHLRSYSYTIQKVTPFTYTANLGHPCYCTCTVPQHAARLTQPHFVRWCRSSTGTNTLPQTRHSSNAGVHPAAPPVKER